MTTNYHNQSSADHGWARMIIDSGFIDKVHSVSFYKQFYHCCLKINGGRRQYLILFMFGSLYFIKIIVTELISVHLLR